MRAMMMMRLAIDFCFDEHRASKWSIMGRAVNSGPQ
jgi:hypothetical protein